MKLPGEGFNRAIGCSRFGPALEIHFFSHPGPPYESEEGSTRVVAWSTSAQAKHPGSMLAVAATCPLSVTCAAL